MKKLFGIVLMMAVVAGGFTANAQIPTAPVKERTEKFDKQGKFDRKDKKDRLEQMDRKKDRKEFQGDRNMTPKHHGKAQRPDLFEGITLTQEQQSKLEALKAEHKAQRGGEKGNRDKMSKDDRQARRAEFSAKVKEILTPEQWVIYEQNVEKMMANHPRKNRK